MLIDKNVGIWDNSCSELEDVVYQLYVNWSISYFKEDNVNVDQKSIIEYYTSTFLVRGIKPLFYNQVNIILRREKIDRIKKSIQNIL